MSLGVEAWREGLSVRKWVSVVGYGVLFSTRHLPLRGCP